MVRAVTTGERRSAPLPSQQTQGASPMPLIVQTHKPVFLIGYGKYSTGNEPLDRQVRYGAGAGSMAGQLVEYVSVADDQDDVVKMSLAPEVAAMNGDKPAPRTEVHLIIEETSRDGKIKRRCVGI